MHTIRKIIFCGSSGLRTIKGTQSDQKSSFLFCFQNANRLELRKSFKLWVAHLPIKREIRMRFESQNKNADFWPVSL